MARAPSRASLIQLPPLIESQAGAQSYWVQGEQLSLPSLSQHLNLDGFPQVTRIETSLQVDRLASSEDTRQTIQELDRYPSRWQGRAAVHSCSSEDAPVYWARQLTPNAHTYQRSSDNSRSCSPMSVSGVGAESGLAPEWTLDAQAVRPRHRAVKGGTRHASLPLLQLPTHRFQVHSHSIPSTPLKNPNLDLIPSRSFSLSLAQWDNPGQKTPRGPS